MDNDKVIKFKEAKEKVLQGKNTDFVIEDLNPQKNPDINSFLFEQYKKIMVDFNKANTSNQFLRLQLNDVISQLNEMEIKIQKLKSSSSAMLKQLPKNIS